jgi:hypothetical protein
LECHDEVIQYPATYLSWPKDFCFAGIDEFMRTQLRSQKCAGRTRNDKWISLLDPSGLAQGSEGIPIALSPFRLFSPMDFFDQLNCHAEEELK